MASFFLCKDCSFEEKINSIGGRKKVYSKGTI